MQWTGKSYLLVSNYSLRVQTIESRLGIPNSWLQKLLWFHNKECLASEIWINNVKLLKIFQIFYKQGVGVIKHTVHLIANFQINSTTEWLLCSLNHYQRCRGNQLYNWIGIFTFFFIKKKVERGWRKHSLPFHSIKIWNVCVYIYIYFK